jgi:hypothetical protein
LTAYKTDFNLTSKSTTVEIGILKNSTVLTRRLRTSQSRVASKTDQSVTKREGCRWYVDTMHGSIPDPRRSPRSKVVLAATLESGGRAFPVTLCDLCEHGALVEARGGLTAECEVWFCRNELRVHGHVAWAAGKLAGIAFSQVLKPDEVLRYINRPEPDRR